MAVPGPSRRLCSIGGEACAGDLVPFPNFDAEERLLLKVRSGNRHIEVVCPNHIRELLTFYESHQRKCCDPFSRHKKLAFGKAVAGDRVISLAMFQKSKKVTKFSPYLVPGNKLCKRCFTDVNTELEEACGSSPSTTPSSSQDFAAEIIEQAGGVENVISGNPAQHSTPAPVLEPEIMPTKEVSCSQGSQDTTTGSQTTSAPADSERKDPTYNPPDRLDEVINNINSTVFRPFNVSPVLKRRMQHEPGYGQRKLRRLENECESLFQGAGAHPLSFQNLDKNFYEDIMEGLKQKFVMCETYEEKVKLLSIPLITLSNATVLEEFGPIGATDYMVRKTVSLMLEQGTILPVVKPRTGRSLPIDTQRAVLTFYETDDLASRMMPGSKDYVSVTENGKRVHKQKRLVLCELKELHRLFKEETNIQISFSKFASLRPKHCVLAGAAGTHSVCVCKYHQNFKLLCDSSGFVGFDGSGAETYKDVLASVLCDPPQDDCFLLKCSKCPGLNPLIKKLSDMFEENMIENITYQQWTTVDRCSLETITQSSDLFIDTFSNQLKVLLPHHFIAKTQSKYLKQLKETLKEGEVVVILDFAQNYLCLIQDAIQSYYWKNDQVTLHPFVAYYIEDGELKKLPLTFVSDYMKHDVQAVYAAQCKLIPFLKARVPNFKIVKYFSDGAASQYKNKFNIYNLSYHETDFRIQAEWHFFATSHGKGVCDGVAGSLKRNAKSASIRKVLIRNPREFYKWAKYRQDLHDGTKVAFVSVQDVEESRIVLEKRLEKALSITNIRSSHTFIPTSQSEIVVKRHSFDETGLFAAVELQRKKAIWTDVQETAFVTIEVGATWKLGQVFTAVPTSNKIVVTCLKKVKNEFKLPGKPDLIEVQLEEILTVVQPYEENGKYTLSVNDVNRTVWQLHSKTHFDKQVQSQNEENIIVIPPLFVEWKDIDLETFVIVQVENAWVAGKIIWTEPETEEVIVSCYRRESNREFLATQEDDDAMPFQLRDILLIVHPTCQDDILKISKDEYTKAEERVRVQTEVQV